MKYRKKPVVIDAEQFFFMDGLDSLFLQEAVCSQPHDGHGGGYHIHTLEGMHEVRDRDYIIRGVKGEYYPCKPDIFEMTYEPVEERKETK